MDDYIIVGDSHAVYNFSRAEKPCIYAGPRTAFKLYSHHKDISRLIENRKRKYIFYFGEIDCRIHIYLKSKGDEESIIEGCKATASSYVNYIQKLISSGWDISILSIPPTGEVENEYKYPVYGDIEDRRYITELLNLMISLLCYNYDIKYYNLYPKLIDEDGYRRKDLIADEVHLNSKVSEIFYETFLG